MSVSDADSRKLSFPLQNPEVIAGDTPNDGTPIIPFAWSTLDNDEKVQITLELSLNEYVALASAIDVGRDIAYGADTNLIWWIWTRSLIEGGAMTCEQIIECITNDADTQEAFKQYLASEGFSQSPENSSASDIEPIPTAMSDSNMLPIGYDCASSNANMAIARAIVRELHESILDVLESIEYATNAAEAANIATDGTPILGTLNNVLELADWFLESLTELYQASYTQAVEDELSCDIFCHLDSECSLSLNELIDIYEAAGGQIPTDMSSLQAAINELVDIPLSVGIATVATAHCMVLWLLRFGGDVFGIKGWKAIENIIRSSSTYIDVSWEDCDCASVTPTLYWRLLYDFRVSQYDTLPFNNQTVFDSGYKDNLNVAASILEAIFMSPDFGAQYSIKAAAMRSVRRGSIGSGTNDIMTMTVYTGANLTGSGSTFKSIGSITCNTNDCDTWELKTTSTANIRSMAFTNRVAIATSSQSEKELRVYLTSIIGDAGPGNTKPPNAEWYGDTPPATIEDMFS